MRPVRAITLLAALIALIGCQTPEVSVDPEPVHPSRRPYMQWWREARFGMFVHYGPFSQWHEYTTPEGKAHWEKRKGLTGEARDRHFVSLLKPDPNFADHWARTAKAAGMKYIVFCAKHHEGFVLWDTKLTNFNSTRMGPGFDMIRPYVAACRKYDLGVGLYYSLFDGHHPDGITARYDAAAHRRLMDYTQGLVRELMTHYGKIDILWYDGPMPLGYGGEWEGYKLNAMVRKLQPTIAINDRVMVRADFTCPENAIIATRYPDEDWEACMTFNDIWLYKPEPVEKFKTPRDIIDMLWQCTRSGGNLLLNVGPRAMGGRIGTTEQERLAAVGKWLKVHGEAVYGKVSRVELLKFCKPSAGKWTRKGNVGYLWLPDWPVGGEITIENVRTRLAAASIVGTGQKLSFEQTPVPDTPKLTHRTRITLRGLPKKCPDPICNYAILKLEFESYPR